jgi:hypothetical protein
MPVPSESERATTTRRAGAPPTRPSTSYRDSALGVFALLLAFRIVNALTLRTFFQPDEFFQSLEPAWQLAFGDTSNAWITWVNCPLLDPLHVDLVGCSTHETSRSGEHICGRPCIQGYLQQSTKLPRHLQTSVA